MIRSRTLTTLFLLASLGCTDEAEERRALQEALARLPQDTSTPVQEEVVEQPDPGLPIDTSLFGLSPDTVIDDSTSNAAEVVPAEPDTGGPRLRPGPPQDTAPWIPVRDSLPLSPEWTTEPRVGEGTGAQMTVLESVRSASANGYDRIVFEFRSGRLPGYRVHQVNPPVRQCGSGQVVPLEGDDWLRVSLEPSQAHDDRGRPTVRERSQRVDLPILRELRLICDYEGQVEWILRLDSEAPFRVTQLRNPARIVIDVRSE